MNHYDELLIGLYTGQTPVWLPTSVGKRYEADSLKRRLDISQRLWEGWSQSSFYANAIFQEKYLFGVCSHFPDARFSTSTITGAVEYALNLWLNTIKDRKVYELFAYESLLHPNMRKDYTGSFKDVLCERVGLPNQFTLEVFKYDIVEFFNKVRYFKAVHAPDIWLKEFEPPMKFTALAVYQQEEDIVARDVTALILELESKNEMNC